MVVEKLKEREDKRDEERDKVHNPDLEQRVAELERVVRELIQYKSDIRIEHVEMVDGKMRATGIDVHDYNFNS